MKVYEVAQATFASGKAYMLSWNTPEGRKQQKFGDPEEAIAEGKLVAGKLATGQTEASDMTRADRAELHAARAITPHILSALREWERIQKLTNGHGIAAAELWAQQNAKTLKRILAPAAVEEFIALKDRAGKQGTRTYGSKLKPIKTHFADRYLDSLTAADWGAYLEQYQDGVTRNDFRKRAVALCRWAQKAGYIPRGVQLEIENTERASEAATEIGTITPETFGKLLEFFRANHPQHLPALVLAGFAAIRSDEIHGKRDDRAKRQLWEDIDLDAKHLNVTVAKKNTPSWRLVTLCDAAVEWLKLSTDRKGPVCEEGAMEKVRALAIAAGYDLPENCFRHSAISYRIAVTGDKAATATWAGNSVKEIDKRYRRPMTKAAGEAWFATRPKQG